MTNGRYEYDMEDMVATKTLIEKDSNRYDISKRLFEQLKFNHNNKQNGKPALSYREFPSEHEGHLNNVKERTLANILKKYELTEDRYYIAPHGRVIFNKDRSGYANADSYMLKVVFDHESNSGVRNR
jgi:hypothetical protein